MIVLCAIGYYNYIINLTENKAAVKKSFFIRLPFTVNGIKVKLLTIN